MDLPILSRATHEELIKSHRLLMEAYINASKTPQVKQSLEEVAQGNALGNVDTPALGSWHTLLKLVDSDFPLVRFWYKTSWKTHNKGKKDTTELEASSGQRGSTCAAQGENVNLLFIENANGTPITGTLAAEMREHTRSIWRGLHKKMPPWRSGAMRLTRSTSNTTMRWSPNFIHFASVTITGSLKPLPQVSIHNGTGILLRSARPPPPLKWKKNQTSGRPSDLDLTHPWTHSSQCQLTTMSQKMSRVFLSQ